VLEAVLEPGCIARGELGIGRELSDLVSRKVVSPINLG
jgi:hypothetical protein